MILLKSAANFAAEGRISGLALDFIGSTRVLCTPSGSMAHWLKKRNLRFFKCGDYTAEPFPRKFETERVIQYEETMRMEGPQILTLQF